MAQVQQPTDPRKKKAAAAFLVLLVVVAAVAIGVGVSMTAEAGDDGLLPPDTSNPDQSMVTVDPAVVTSVAIDAGGTVVVAFDWNTPGFTPRFKLYRAATAFTTVAAATYIKTVLNSQIQDPSDKKITDATPTVGRWFYGITVGRPLGVGLGYAESPMSNVVPVWITSTGPGTTPDPDPDPEPAIAAPTVVSVSAVSAAGTFTLVLHVTTLNSYIYLSTSAITESNYATTYLRTFSTGSYTSLYYNPHTITISIPGMQFNTKYYVAARAVTSTSISPLSNVVEFNSPPQPQ